MRVPAELFVMVISSTRTLPFLLFASCISFGQQMAPPALPDAPSSRTAPLTYSSRLVKTRSSRPAGSSREPLAWRFDPGHFNDDRFRRGPDTNSFGNVSLVKTSNRYRASESNNLFARAIYAASSTFIMRGDDGSTRLNNRYLLKVLTSAAASTADRPYWRRSASQPFADIGSTIGNDAGMNVLHEFQPGILQLVKHYQPRFV